MTIKRKKRPKPGDVFRVRLENGKYIYGYVTERGGYPFFDKQFDAVGQVNCDELLSLPVIFRVWVADFAFKADKWEIIGKIDMQELIKDLPRFFIQDPISKKFSIYHYEDEFHPIPATYEECKNLECAVSWGSTSIESRLEDYFADRPNKAFNAYKAKPS